MELTLPHTLILESKKHALLSTQKNTILFSPPIVINGGGVQFENSHTSKMKVF